eukprot:TRINITY_DN83_c0_g1_i7.p1 TRINITY_DN83_c0_g1~~TRINITY_DN83_c0_g1_i7.p1  ORF type:complete len:573 (-),score=75.39 TRINITY_DN83_c0_g1_i7:144-1862(-)
MFLSAAADVVSTFTTDVLLYVRCALDQGATSARAGTEHFLVLLLLCGIMMLDTYHLLFMLLGAAFFWALQKIQPEVKRERRTPAKIQQVPNTTRKAPSQQMSTGSNGVSPYSPSFRSRPSAFAVARRDETATRRLFASSADAVMKVEKTRVPLTAAVPVAAPIFTSTAWDTEVDELVGQISPTPTCVGAIDKLVNVVTANLKRIDPSVQVVGFASGDLKRGKAFGVAVPNVDLVVTVSFHALARCDKQSQNRSTVSNHSSGSSARVDAAKLHKSAIRAFTEHLVWGGGFKFRRSAFRGLDPKVTLLSPCGILGFEEGIPVDIYVNAATPLYSASLLTDSGSFDIRARELVLLVKRWCKDRGVGHAAKGHLPPYVWNLLTIYFLQVGTEEPILPPVANFPLTSSLAQHIDSSSVMKLVASSKAAACMPRTTGHRSSQTEGSTESTGALLKGFFAFYAKRFDWANEAVSVRQGRRCAPDKWFPLHVIVDDTSSNIEIGPSIEDPFDPGRNLGSCMTSSSLARLREELARAEDICCCSNGNEAALVKLLQPWTPPEQETEPGSFPEEDSLDVGRE